MKERSQTRQLAMQPGAPLAHAGQLRPLGVAASTGQAALNLVKLRRERVHQLIDGIADMLDDELQ